MSSRPNASQVAGRLTSEVMTIVRERNGRLECGGRDRAVTSEPDNDGPDGFLAYRGIVRFSASTRHTGVCASGASPSAVSSTVRHELPEAYRNQTLKQTFRADGCARIAVLIAGLSTRISGRREGPKRDLDALGQVVRSES